MKRFSSLITAFVLTLLICTTAQSVSAISPGRAVHGVIRDSGNDRVAGADVVVSCNGNVVNTTTNGIGFYIIQFANQNDCKKKDLVTTSASKGPEAGSKSKKMGAVQVNINVKMSAVAVPEFGFGTGLMAMVASAGAFTFFKKQRHVAQ